MKIILCSTFMPFINGGYRNIVEWLFSMLKREGHEVEIVYLPEADHPELLYNQMFAFRWIDFSSADRVICFRPQSHLISHPHKIVWFIHHIRHLYDLWGSVYCKFPDNAQYQGIRNALYSTDTAALLEAKHIFTNSIVVKDRLKKMNNVDSEVLYPPVLDAERFYCRQYNDEIVYICRLEHHKRQHLIIEAMHYTKTPVRLRICGTGTSNEYSDSLRMLISNYDLTEKVSLVDRWISEDEKVELLADCLAVAYLPLDEDSYGYPSLEASHACKAIITTYDSGGVLELVQHGVNGLITEPKPEEIAKVMDQLYLNRIWAEELGKNAKDRLRELNISWYHVLSRLLA